MSGLITGLNIGKSALHAQQSALQVVGNNIANVNTPGYSRQKVKMICGKGQANLIGNQFLSGVTVEGASRVRDVLIDRYLRRETQNLGRYETLSNSLSQIESIFNEPSDTGLSSLMSRFFNAFADLANNPQDLSARMVLLQRGATLSDAINETHFSLRQLKQDIGETLFSKIKEVNNIAFQIANLNGQIKNTEAVKGHVSQLQDRRDFLVDQLSKFIDIDVLEAEDGTFSINAGGKTLISGISANELEVTTQKLDSIQEASVRLVGSNSKVNIRSGELKGLLDAENSIIPNYLRQLDDLAAGLAFKVNELHKTGFGLDGSTGNSFFTFTSVSSSDNTTAASSIAINEAIFADPRKIAASAESDAPSDNSIAMMISQLRTKEIMNEDTATVFDFYQSMIAELGVQCKDATQFFDAQKLVVSQISQRRESVSGVEISEEAINLLNYQSAYAAAARYINTINELLDVVVNRL